MMDKKMYKDEDLRRIKETENQRSTTEDKRRKRLAIFLIKQQEMKKKRITKE
jgi:hypothetical protein